MAPEPSQKPFYLALGAVALVIAFGIGFLIFNIVSHATNKVTTTPVSTSVVSVTPKGESEVTIVATVTSRSTSTSSVNCLIGVERPATPLAFPIRITEHLAAGESKTITVSRSLIKPQANFVTTTDIAFTCT